MSPSKGLGSWSPYKWPLVNLQMGLTNKSIPHHPSHKLTIPPIYHGSNILETIQRKIPYEGAATIPHTIFCSKFLPLRCACSNILLMCYQVWQPRKMSTDHPIIDPWPILKQTQLLAHYIVTLFAHTKNLNHHLKNVVVTLHNISTNVQLISNKKNWNSKKLWWKIIKNA